MNVLTQILNNTLIVTINGELDDHNTINAREQIDYILLRKEIKNIIFDLSALELMDSSGIGLLMGRYRQIKVKDGVGIVVFNKEKLEKILNLSGILSIYKSTDSLKKAKEILKIKE